MIIHDAATLVRTVYSLYNAHQTDAEWLDKTSMLVSENCEALNTHTGHIGRGKEGFKQRLLNWSTAFPDSSNEITNVVATNDQAAVEFISRGTHRGVLHTPKGDIQPTNRKIELRCCDVYRISNDEERNKRDRQKGQFYEFYSNGRNLGDRGYTGTISQHQRDCHDQGVK